MRIAVGLTAAALIAAAAAYAISPRHAPPLRNTQIPIEQMQLNTIARSNIGFVMGGELGHILLSSDEGNHWRDAKLSRSRDALIDQISFANGQLGIAVGHEGWILRTHDGGINWQEEAFDKKNGEPLMSVARVAQGKWIAVGAFGRMLRSDDNGKTWTPFEVAGVGDHHLNRIVGAVDQQHWIIVGERGLILLSDDAGQTWTKVPPFYQGSFYGAISLGSNNWLVYGMLGNVYRSTDGGRQWEKIDLPVAASVFGGTRTRQGTILLVAQGGVVLESTDDGRQFKLLRQGARATLTDIIHRPGGWLITSDTGLKSYNEAMQDMPAPNTLAAAQTNSGVAQ